MDQGSSARVSRRALVSAAAAAAAALAAESLARPLSTAAANGDPVKLGQLNSSSQETAIRYERVDNVHAAALTVQSFGNGEAIHAEQVHDGDAITAFSDTGRALLAIHQGPSPIPTIQAECETGPAVWGSSTGAAGIRGTGVPGVLGEADGGVGVSGKGTGTHGQGVVGTSDSDIGVKGHSGSSVGVHAGSGTGHALWAAGPVHFQTAGRGTVQNGQTRATVHPLMGGVGLSSSSKVLVTLMSNPMGRAVAYVRVNPAAGSFDVVLTGTAKADTLFAYFVMS